MKKIRLYIIAITSLLISISGTLSAQIITGYVLSDASGTPLPGVNILVQGTGIGAMTNSSGQYTIGTGLTVGTTYNVSVSAVGYGSMARSITLVSGTNYLGFWFGRPTLPSASISGSTTVCKDAASPNITFTASNGVPPNIFTYTVNGGSNQTVTSASSSSVTVSVPTGTTGTYSYSLVSLRDMYSDVSSSGNATVTINSLPTGTISGTTSVCRISASPNITFTGAGATAPYTFTYRINSGSNLTVTTSSGNSVTVPAPTGTAGTFTYTLVSVLSANVCAQAQTGNAIVTVNPLPTATISGTTAICRNAASPNITFTGASGTAPYTFTYTINSGSNQTVTTTAGNSVTVAVPTGTAGTFTYSLVSVRDASSTACTQVQGGSAVVTVNPLPTGTISGTTAVCRNAASPNIMFTGASGTAPYTFTYTINSGSNQTVTTTAGNSVAVTVPTGTAGTFTYSLVSVRDASSTACSQAQSGNAVVTVNPLPTATISGTTTVLKDSPSPNITFTGSNGTAPYTFTYTINSGTNQTVTTTTGNSVTVSASTSVAGTFTYSLVSVRDASTTTCTQVQTGSAVVTVALGLPTITTNEITNISSTWAQSGGNITGDGGSTVTERGVCWSITPNPTIINSHTSDGIGNGSFTSTITGLAAGTSYYLRAYATNSAGTAYGNSLTFTTDASNFPVLTTLKATEITPWGATAGGDITFSGVFAIQERGICWSTEPEPTILNQHVFESDLGENGLGIYSLTFGELNSGMTYYLRAYAINEAGTSYGNEITFTTYEDNAIADIEGNYYNIIDIGNQTWMAENLRTTRYNDNTIIPNVTLKADWITLTSPAYCWYNNDVLKKDLYGAYYNWYVLETNKLCPSGWHVPTQEEYNVLFEQLGGLSVASDKLRETGNEHWTVPNVGATNESGFTALPSGSRYGIESEYDFYGQGSLFFTWTSTIYPVSDPNGITLINSPEVLLRNYYKETGVSVRCLKDDLEISPPIITTSSNSYLASNSASFGGEVTSDGGSPVITRGVCWSESSNPILGENNFTSDGTGTGSFISKITGLIPNTVYYLRAYATNSAGTTYGDEVTFTTTIQVSDYDNNTYNTVKIGDQLWMQENLKTTKYRDGASIPNTSDNALWVGTKAGAYCDYGNNPSNSDNSGRLYNWYAVIDGHYLCPTGWHVPSKTEWTNLNNFLSLNGYGYEGSGSDIAKSIAEISGWTLDPTPGNIGNEQVTNNSSGFAAVPGGSRSAASGGSYINIGSMANWWSSDNFDNSLAIGPFTGFDRSYLYIDQAHIKANGFSVRCMQGEGQVLPLITTRNMMVIATSSANSGGDITSDGGSPVTARGVCWSTTSGPTIADNHTTDGPETGIFLSNIKGLNTETKYYLRAYATNSVGTAYGNEISFTTTSKVADIDGYNYNTIIIGTQTWMQENLKTTKYANGDIISDGTLKGDLTSEPAPKYWFTYKDNDPAYSFYGKYYTWYAAIDRRNICPTGWHVPTEPEWNILKYYLIANGYGYGVTDNVGKALASENLWEFDPTAGNPGNDQASNNSTGFNGQPGGNRNWKYDDPSVKFYGDGKYVRFQSLTEWDSVTSIMGKLDMNLSDLNVWADGKKHGFNVRCLKGDPPNDIIYLPTLSTTRITSITKTTVSTGGTIVTDGYNSIIERGICWSTNPHPTTESSILPDAGTSTGTFVTSITGLTAGKKYYLRAYAKNEAGTAYGEELTFTTYRTDAVTDVDGNYYNIVEIGTQIWLQENLRTTRYSDGGPIPLITDGDSWYNLTTDAYCFLNNDQETNKDVYGALYNYSVVTDSRNVCPLGWRVPTDGEWATLTSYLGGVAVAGGKMKEQGTTHWTAPNIVSETVSGFTALGAGERLPNGNYGYLGTSTFYWSTTEYSTTHAWTNAIVNNSAVCDHAPNEKKWGFSVRCINDQLMVTNTNDSGVGSFRNALDYSNSNDGKDTIVFKIPGLGPFTIAPLTPFPVITDSVFIDGYSQPGTGRASSNTAAKLLIELDGINLPESMGLYVTVGKCKISGLMINRFGIDGIQLVYGGGNIIEGNYIGVDATGQAKVNLTGALRIAASPDNIIGGSKPENRNVMAAGPNGGSYLIFMLSPQTANNWITGNYLGVGPDGEAKIGQSKIGIQLNEGSHHNTIGPRNIISGNSEAGIQLQPLEPNFPNNNKIIGNFIGTNKTGTVAVGNKNGIAIYNSSENIIGGKTPYERNVISGNTNNGIIINLGLILPFTGNTVQGNFIGLNAAGDQALKNGGCGLWIYAKENKIGGPEAGAGNVISGNSGSGIFIHGFTISDVESNSSANLIQGNLIGTDYTGLKPIGNENYGIEIGHFSANNKIGGIESGMGNIIAYNKLAGVACVGTIGTVTGNNILSNSIHSNGELGIDLGATGVTPNDSTLFEEPDVYHFDNDPGPNNLQNFPVISTVKFDLGIKKVILGGYLKSTANSYFTLQFFANKIDDAKGYGEGQRYLGTAKVKTGADGKAVFDTSFTHYSSWGDIISATATDALGNTSEFSMNIGGITRQIIAESSWPFYYQVNADGILRITDESDIAAVDSSFSAWNQISTATIDFRSGGTTTNQYASSNDGVNLVTFTDDKFPFSPGVLAVAAKTLRLSPNNDIAEIIDADIVVNPSYARYAVGVGYEGSNAGYFDAQSLITHEIGHVLGLLHTGIVSSTMFYMLDNTTYFRDLEQDDVSWASYSYPNTDPNSGNTYSGTFGSISGKIIYGYDPLGLEPVAGALVVAINTSTNEEVHAYSDADGIYTVPGLEPGTYNIHIQPLDGSENVNNLKPANISAYIYNNTVYTDYPGEYYSSPETGSEDPATPEIPLPVPVSAGVARTGIDLITNKDLAGPVVVTVTPVNNTPDFDINKDIIVTFSEPVDPATLTDETCYIESKGTKHGVSHTPLGNSSSVIMLAPGSPFKYITEYTLHITAGVKDLRGNQLVPPDGLSEYKSAFTTINADLTPPEIINVYPLDGASDVFVTDRIIVFFSEPMNRTSVENSLIVSWIDDQSVVNKSAGSYAWGTDNKSVTFIPLKTLMEDEEYTITVTKGATDLAGLSLSSEKLFTFLTVQAAPPEVMYIGPDNGTLNNSITTPVVVDFSEPINPYTVSKSTFGLFLLNGTPVPGTYKFLNDNSRVVYTPDADLDFSTTYTVVLTSGIKDLPAPGLNLLNPSTTTFRTADKPQAVTLTYIDPPAGAIGSVVTIGGVGFDPDPSKNTIKFNGISAVVTASTLTTLTTEVPVGAISGFVTVTGANNAPATNQMDFYVVPQSTDPCESATANSSAGSTNTGGTDLYGEALVFVTNPLSNTVTVVNTKAGSTGSPIVATIDVGQRPMKIDINPQGTMAYVSNYLSNDVSVIDIATWQVVATIKVGIHPYGVAVTPDGKRVYVANQYTNNLSVIDVDPKSGGFDHVVANVPVGTNPNDVEITGDAGLVLVTGDFGLEIINGNPNDEKYNCAVANVASGTKTTDVEVTADAGLAIVATEDNNLLVINLHPEDGDYTDAVVANVPAGTDVSNIQVSGDAMFVYVSAPDSDVVQMYRIGYGSSGTPNGSGSGDFTLVRHSTIYGLENPDAMVIDPFSINLFVVNDGPDEIIREITTITLCCGPVDPAKTISDLIATIQDMNINQSIKDDLAFRLNEVLRNLAAGKINTALNNLNTFNNKITSLINSRKITREQGQPLIDAANKLKDQINLLPKGKSGDIENPETGLLNESGLGVIYPNPSGKSFTIEYEISELDDLAGKVSVRIIDVNGNMITTLLDMAVHTGRYTLTWNGTSGNGMPAPGGTYFVHFRAGNVEKIKMIILIR